MKKALALILTLIMVLGLMPAAMAATDDPIQDPIRSVTKTDKDLVINKSVNPNDDGSYALTIEAYATGTSSTTTQSVPLDIVLVLDVSGSMEDTFSNDEQYIAQESQAYTARTIWYSDTLYYKYKEDYYAVQVDSTGYWWEYRCVLSFRDKDNNVHYLYGENVQDEKPDYLPAERTIYTGVLYKRTKPSKMYVLKTAVNNFIDKVEADASKNKVNHQIAIVKFAGTMNQDVGNDKYKEGWYSYNYSQTVVGLTDVSVSGNENTLKQKVSELTHGGATAADYGMQLAKGLLSGSHEGRKQIVVMFTDGEPNHENGFDEDVANAAISAAKAMKDREVTVYTIGAIQQPSDRVKNFLDYTSSNYPGANSMDNAGEQAADKYYKLVSTETALADIFETIASETTQTSAVANASSVLEDKLTGYFNFANFSGGNITGYTVKTAARTGDDTWGTPAEASDVLVSVKGNDTIDITGFDYTSADNLVVNKGGKWQGHKLIVTFNIVLNESAEGWQAGRNRVPTNAHGFACIKGQDDKPLIALTESPEVDVYAYVVKYKVTGDVPESFTPNIPADKVYLAGKPVAVAEDLKTTVTSNNGQEGVWTFNGWKKGGEGIQTIQIPNGPAADYTITINGTWTFAPTEQFGLLTIAKNFGGNSAINANNWPEGKPLTFTIQKVNDDGTTAGTTGDPTTVTLPKDGKWTDTVQLAPGTYTVTESDSDADVDGYDLTVSNSTITEQTPTADGKTGTVTVTAGTTPATITFINTYTPETIDITVTKEWVDNENEHPSVTVKLLADGQAVEGKTLTLGATAPTGGAQWTGTFMDLPKYNAEGKEIKYTVQEDPVPEGYNSEVTGTVADGFTITNTYKEPGKISINVQKEWAMKGLDNIAKPDEVTIKLFKGNEDTGKTLTLNQSNQWKGTFANLDVVENVTYSIEEEVVEGYTSEISSNTTGDGFTVKNTLITYPVQIKKEASGLSDGTTYPNVTVDIKQGDKVIKTITGLVPNGNAQTVELPAGEYTVEEQEDTAKVEGYNLNVTNAKLKVTAPVVAARSTAPDAVEPLTATVINKYTKMEDNTGSLIVKKTVSGNGADFNKAFTFKVTLTIKGDIYNDNNDNDDVIFTNGEATFQLKNGESKTFIGLPEGIHYTVTESDNDGYTVTVNNTNATTASGDIVAKETAIAAFNNYKRGGGHYDPTPDPVPPIVIPPKTGDMTIWQSILNFLGIR